ncbi:LOW QUALITY PROTEIN: uncharacterized protein EMH_0059650 [Eimeria mitis]|uniref:Uncharacterized protein n=1 Tax=Eimeria mitis TaxID=44415 RepID=U6KII8_9EIME|nr:LOW QUALITY PROTEIN: uncharacterized protein EMH_0059650 [Eimeria mitis]CDJ36072.1 hypothetical protein EMH_0059650 [Eimeria mitis]
MGLGFPLACKDQDLDLDFEASAWAWASPWRGYQGGLARLTDCPESANACGDLRSAEGACLGCLQGRTDGGAAGEARDALGGVTDYKAEGLCQSLLAHVVTCTWPRELALGGEPGTHCRCPYDVVVNVPERLWLWFGSFARGLVSLTDCPESASASGDLRWAEGACLECVPVRTDGGVAGDARGALGGVTV